MLPTILVIRDLLSDDESQNACIMGKGRKALGVQTKRSRSSHFLLSLFLPAAAAFTCSSQPGSVGQRHAKYGTKPPD